MKNIYKIIIALIILVPTVAFGARGGIKTTELNLGAIAPTGINQGNGFINPLRIGDRIEAAYFIASSSVTKSTFPYASTTVISATGICISTDCRTVWPTGGGGSGGGTWSTTTSTVAGRLINYPNNTTDIINVGSNSTTTGKFYYDPNTTKGFMNGSFVVGTAQPTYADDNLSVVDFVTDVNGYTFVGIQNKNTGTTASSDLVFANNKTTITDYYVDCGISGGNNTDPLFTGIGGASAYYCFNTDGPVSFGIGTTTAGSDFNWTVSSDGGNSYLTSDIKMKLTNGGNLGIGTTSPYAKLSVVGDTGVVAEKYTATSTTAFSTFAGRVGVSTTSPAQKLEVSDGNLFISSANGSGRGIILSTDVMDDSSRPSIKFLRNNFAAFLADDHTNQTFNFMTALSSTRTFNSTIRAYGSETGGFANYAGLTHDGTDGSIITGAGDLVLSPSSLKVGIGTSSPATELNVAATLPEITLSDVDATTNLKHWFIEADSGVFAIGTTSDQLVKTTTRPFSISSNGQIAIGNKDSITSRLNITGGSTGTALMTLIRPSVAQFSLALPGGGLAFSDDLNGGFAIVNLLGDVQSNQLYVGQKGLNTLDGRTDIISATSFGASAGTDVKGHPLEIIAGRGTGAGTPGDMKFSTGLATGSGTTAQSTSTRLFISGSTGNVGIGTTSPTISGTSLSNFIIGSAAGTNTGMALDGSSTGTGLRYGFASNGTLVAGILRNNNLGTLTISNSTAGASDIVIDSTGNIGLASTTPSSSLSVGGVGTATSTIYFDSGTNKGTCMIMKDSDGTGVTYVTANNGSLKASTVPCK